jgi:hypothetical protein
MSLRSSTTSSRLACCLASVVLMVSASVANVAPATASQDPSLTRLLELSPEIVHDAARSLKQGPSGVALKGSVDGLDIEISSSAGGGLTVGSGQSLDIGLPFGDAAEQAVVDGSGLVSFDNNNGSTTVPAVLEDGTIQISTIIESPSSPTVYEYPISLPDGASLREGPEGVTVVDLDGDVLGTFQPPWAVDAAGVDVPTRYELSGSVLRQWVGHDATNSYPVVADPRYTTLTYYLSRSQVETAWSRMGNWDGYCRFIPLPYLAGVGCAGPSTLRNAVTQAHHQRKRIKAVFYNCGANYCNYYNYHVVS